MSQFPSYSYVGSIVDFNAIKEEGKVINLDFVNNLTWILSNYVITLSNFFETNDTFSELLRKISPTYNCLNLFAKFKLSSCSISPVTREVLSLGNVLILSRILLSTIQPESYGENAVVACSQSKEKELQQSYGRKLKITAAALKQGRSAGIDNTPTELVRAGGVDHGWCFNRNN